MSNFIKTNSSVTANEIDTHIAKRIKLRRTIMGLTQAELAEHALVSPQQVQKYEAAANRVSASTLWLIAQALKVNISFFYSGLSNDTAAPTAHTK